MTAVLLASAIFLPIQAVDAASVGSYDVSKNSAGVTIVKDSRGVSVSSSKDSATAIQYAIDHTVSGGVVTVNAGAYTLSKSVSMKSGVTLAGVGSTTVFTNGEIVVRASNVVLKSFAMKGTCGVYISASTADVSNIALIDLTATTGVKQAVYYVEATSRTISNVQMIRCTAIDSSAYGFQFSGSTSGTIRDVILEDCKAIRCGITARPNDWVSGFVLALNAKVVNLKAIRCQATQNWEDGFFLQAATSKTNVVLQDCISSNNGQKPLYKEGYGYLIDQTVVLNNCTGTGNKGGLTNLATPPSVVKGQSSVTLTLASPSVQIGSNMHASGLLSGTAGIPSATMTLKVTKPDGTIAYPTQGSSLVTGSSGTFAIDYAPATVGTYKFTATFAGNDQFNGSTVIVSFNAIAQPVVASPSTITLTLASSSVQTGSSIHATGVLKGSSGISGATVSLKVILPNGSTSYPTQGATVTTDSQGNFVMDYVPTTTGTYKLVANFAGNTQYNASVGSASFTAVTPSAGPPAPPVYNYKVVKSGSSYLVYDAAGSLKATKTYVNQAVIWASTQLNSVGGGVIYLPYGTYQMGGGSQDWIYLHTNVKLIGDGSSGQYATILNGLTTSCGISNNGNSHVTIKGLRLTGYNQISIGARASTTVTDILVEDVYMDKVTHSTAAVVTWTNLYSTIDGITFRKVVVQQPSTWGFLIGGESTTTGWTKNILFEDCAANWCGLSGVGTNYWSPGFDLAEGTNVDGMRLVRCVANDNCEAGFHFEDSETVKNVVFVDCSASNNGIHKVSAFGVKPLYAGGFYIGPHASAITGLDTCSGTNNYYSLIKKW